MGTSFHTLGSAPAAAAGQPVPAWCRYVPVSFQGVACRGSSAGCSCQSLCNGHKDVNNPECCGCRDGGAAAPQQHVAAPASQTYMLRGNLASRVEEPQDLRSTENRTTSFHALGVALAAATGQSAPAWCQYVPASFQGVACRGSAAGCSCQSFCNGHKDGNNPECCGCRDGGAAAPQQHVAAPASQMYML